jgi:hypothetical protein
MRPVERIVGAGFCLLALVGAAALSWHLGSAAERAEAGLAAATKCVHLDADRAVDICAQWAAARAAESAAFWAMLSFYLAAVGTAGLIATIYLTNRSVSAALEAVKAANAQVETAREVANRQLRAYLSAQKGRVRDFKVGSKPTFRVDLRNNGQTPAHHCRRRFHLIEDAEDPDLFRFRFDEATRGADIGPGHERTLYYTFDEPLDAKKMAAFEAGEYSPVFAGAVSYLDAFRRTRRAVFRLFLRPYMLDEQGNGYLSLCVKNNCAN